MSLQETWAIGLFLFGPRLEGRAAWEPWNGYAAGKHYTEAVATGVIPLSGQAECLPCTESGARSCDAGPSLLDAGLPNRIPAGPDPQVVRHG